jgi:hypothetical protein
VIDLWDSLVLCYVRLISFRFTLQRVWNNCSGLQMPIYSVPVDIITEYEQWYHARDFSNMLLSMLYRHIFSAIHCTEFDWSLFNVPLFYLTGVSCVCDRRYWIEVFASSEVSSVRNSLRLVWIFNCDVIESIFVRLRAILTIVSIWVLITDRGVHNPKSSDRGRSLRPKICNKLSSTI